MNGAPKETNKGITRMVKSIQKSVVQWDWALDSRGILQFGLVNQNDILFCGARDLTHSFGHAGHVLCYSATAPVLVDRVSLRLHSSDWP